MLRWVRGAGETGEQAADLVAGQRDQPGGGWFLVCGQHGEDGVGEHGQQGPSVPRGPGADLVVVQGGELFGSGEAVLDAPPESGNADKGFQGDRTRGVGAVRSKVRRQSVLTYGVRGHKD